MRIWQNQSGLTRRDRWQDQQPEAGGAGLRSLGESLCHPVVLRSVGLIGLVGVAASLVVANPLMLDSSADDRAFAVEASAPEAEAATVEARLEHVDAGAPQGLRSTIAPTWESSTSFSGAVEEAAAAAAERVAEPATAELAQSVAAPKTAFRAVAQMPRENVPAAQPERPAAPQQPIEVASAGPETTGAIPAQPQMPATAAVELAAGAESEPGPQVLALAPMPPEPGELVAPITEPALLAPLPQVRPDEVPEAPKAKVKKASAKSGSSKWGKDLGPPPNCGDLHAYWRYTDRKIGKREWYCR